MELVGETMGVTMGIPYIGRGRFIRTNFMDCREWISILHSFNSIRTLGEILLLSL